MRWLLLPAVIAGLLAFHYLRSARKRPAPPPPTATERREPRQDHWSGIWGEKKSSALLRIRHQEDGTLVGEYFPPRDRAVLARFSRGTVEGDTARFDVKIDGILWHLQLTRSGGSATLRGCRDLDALLDAYGEDDRLPGGALLIRPRSWEQTITERDRLQRKREEIRQAGKLVPLGTFERIEARR